MNRKGQGMQEHTNDLILGIIMLLVLVGIVTAWYLVFEKKAPEYACRSSVIARENIVVKIPVLPDAKLIPVQCKTLDKTLPEELSSGMSEKERKDQTMKEIADLMAKCWWMFDYGKFNNIFSDSEQNSNLCHVCYTFEISPTAQIGVGIERTEMFTYLRTHSFEQGLLEGGTGSIGSLGRHLFTQQESISRAIAPGKLFNNNDLNRGLADYSTLFAGQENMKSELQATLSLISQKGSIEPAIIIVNRLSEESVKEDSDLAYQFFSEWGVGDHQKKNGIVIIIALENGVALYATQSGADALLPSYVIEELLAHLDEPMKRQAAAVALLKFAEEFNARVDALGTPEEIASLLAFQGSYTSFIGGGVRGPQDRSDEGQVAQGAIAIPENFGGFKPGIPYAISYISPRQQDKCVANVDWLCWGSMSPNMIAISEHQELFKNEPLCNMVK